ncbi:hypothetical protein, partial [Tabrizicola sp.]|uniref:hypothetical protein n=1 Tax=Tabrizicola sp. TaxID=2005166 RepID=UPI0035B00AB8
VLVLAASWQAGGRGFAPLVRLGPVAAAGLAVATLVHAVETARFVRAFDGYAAAIAALARDGVPDPALGHAAFTSSRPADRAFPPIAWHSTTPFLSVLVSPGFAPRHLVVDPAAAYFWFGCAEATANAAARRALPERTRALVRDYACAHRP